MGEVLVTENSTEYTLIDSGQGEKLESFAGVVLRRPDPQALWEKSLGQEAWASADAVFERTSKVGKWHTHKNLNEWVVSLNGLKFSLELLPSKHVGVFPEQSENWNWLEKKIKTKIDLGEQISVLNLFGYTGGATLAASRAGADVVHVDSSKFAVNLAHTNLNISGLSKNTVRFIVDDVRKFVEREIKRGNKYDVIVLDPPVYGKGSKREVWNIDEDLVPLLSRIRHILNDKPTAVLLNGYSSGYSSISYAQVLSGITKDLPGNLTHGELALKDSSGRFLPSGIFARFEN